MNEMRRLINLVESIERLDEINRREFLKKAGMAAMGAGLGTAAVDQGAHAHDDPDLEAPFPHGHGITTDEGPFSYKDRDGVMRKVMSADDIPWYVKTYVKDSDGKIYWKKAVEKYSISDEDVKGLKALIADAEARGDKDEADMWRMTLDSKAIK